MIKFNSNMAMLDCIKIASILNKRYFKMSYSLQNMNKEDVTAIEVIYIGGMRRIFNLNSEVYRYDAMDLQTRLESFKTVFRVNCHTTLNSYF